MVPYQNSTTSDAARAGMGVDNEGKDAAKTRVVGYFVYAGRVIVRGEGGVWSEKPLIPPPAKWRQRCRSMNLLRFRLRPCGGLQQ